MLQITSLSQSIFNQRAQDAIQKQPVRRTVNVVDLKIIDNQKIEFKGSVIKMTAAAFNDLMQILKIPAVFIQRFNKAMSERPETRDKLINLIKNIISRSATNKTVTLVLSPKTKEIIAIHKTDRDLISNSIFIDIVSQIIDSNQLDVVDFSVSDEGNIAINALNTKSEFGIGNPNNNPLYKDEFFYAGVSLTNDVKSGFIVSPYINRLVCANGSIHRGFEETYKLNSTNSDDFKKFFTEISVLAKKDFKPESFVAHVEQAIKLKASLAELYQAKKAIKDAVNDIKPEELERWIPIKYNEEAYSRIGIDCQLLTRNQLKNASSNITVWQLINGLTHFASHDNGFKINDYARRQLQIKAGNILTNEHDGANFVRSPW